MEYRRPVSILPKGVATARLIKALNMERGNLSGAVAIAEGWKDSPEVALTLQTKAETIPMTSYGSGLNLARYGIGNEILELIRGASIIGKLLPKMRKAPLLTTFARETTGAACTWIGENMAIPVVSLAYDSLSLPFYSCEVLLVASNTLLRFSNPDAEAAFTSDLAKAVAKFLDGEFLDATVGLSANFRPASITYQSAAFTSTGSSDSAIESDINSMIGLLQPSESPVFIGRNKTIARTSFLSRAGYGYGNINSIPVIASDNSPQQLVLCDASDILFSEGTIDLDISEQCALVMTDTPESSPVATSLNSLWQRNLAGIRVIRTLSYMRGHTSSVVRMACSY